MGLLGAAGLAVFLLLLFAALELMGVRHTLMVVLIAMLPVFE